MIAASVLATPSDTRTEKEYEPGPWSSPGVQVNAPVDESIDAPVGAPTREKVRVLAGRSGSVAVAGLLKRGLRQLREHLRGWE